MLIVFKAQGAADVLMFGEVAFALMEIMGKQPGERGIVTAFEVPEALDRLRRALAADKAAPKPLGPQDEDTDREADGERRFVSLGQRALPLIGLLEHARREELPVLWGV